MQSNPLYICAFKEEPFNYEAEASTGVEAGWELRCY